MLAIRLPDNRDHLLFAGPAFPHGSLQIGSTSLSTIDGPKILGQVRAVDFGASDVPLNSNEPARLGLSQFPLVIGGVVPVFNVDGVKPGELKFSGTLLRTSSSASSAGGMIPPSRP